MRIRNCLLALTVVLTGATPAFAQLSGGVKAGINFSNLKFEETDADPGFDRRTGFIGGVFVVFPLSAPLSIQAEALYSQNGAKSEEGDVSAQLELDYLDFPVMARLTAPAGTNATFHVFGGPAFGWRVKARSTAELDGETQEDDLDDEFEKFDLGLVVGAGVEFGRLVVDGRYRWGLSDVEKHPTVDVKVKNGTFSIMAGIRF